MTIGMNFIVRVDLNLSVCLHVGPLRVRVHKGAVLTRF